MLGLSFTTNKKNLLPIYGKQCVNTDCIVVLRKQKESMDKTLTNDNAMNLSVLIGSL